MVKLSAFRCWKIASRSPRRHVADQASYQSHTRAWSDRPSVMAQCREKSPTPESEFMNLEVILHAPSQDSNLKTRAYPLASSLQSNVFNVSKFGSPAWIRTTIHGSKGRCPTIRRPGN